MENNGTASQSEEGRWSSKSIGSELQHKIFYVLIGLGGRRAAYALVYAVVFWYVLFYRTIRRKAGFYVDHRFPGCSGLARFRHIFRMCLMLGKVLVDRAIIGILGSDRIDVTFDQKDQILDLLKQEKGIILINSHIGCWQAAMPTLGFLNTPVSMLMHRQEGDIDRHYFEHAGQKSPYRIIDPRGYLGGALEMVAVLKDNQVLSVMGDRIFGNPKNSHKVPFLGEPAAFPISAFKLAIATGTPCVVLHSYKAGPESYALKLADIIELDAESSDKQAQIEAAVARYARLLEDYCRDHPYQFFNFFDMWAEPDPNWQDAL